LRKRNAFKQAVVNTQLLDDLRATFWVLLLPRYDATAGVTCRLLTQQLSGSGRGRGVTERQIHGVTA
jgi:hypothetical protein